MLVILPAHFKYVTTLPCENSDSVCGCVQIRKNESAVRINGTYCHDLLLTEQLLPVMCEISGEFFIFQQDSAPA